MISQQASLSRRAFLAASGALVVTLTESPAWSASGNGAAARPPLTGDALSSYITIETDGTVVAYYGKIDGGQGLGTAIAQMVAEEIDVPFERVRVIMGSTTVLDMGGASAAQGVSMSGMTLRRTAAEARRLLVDLATKTLGVPADQL